VLLLTLLLLLPALLLLLGGLDRIKQADTCRGQLQERPAFEHVAAQTSVRLSGTNMLSCVLHVLHVDNTAELQQRPEVPRTTTQTPAHQCAIVKYTLIQLRLYIHNTTDCA
jgi:hypothetical protein